VIVGVLTTENGTALEVTPPVRTVIWGVETAVSRLAGTAAVRAPLFTKVVARAVAFQWTTEPLVKCAPFTLRVNGCPFTVASGGLMLLMVEAALMVKGRAFDATPPETTATEAEPGAAIRPAGIVTVI
jgi:hypothetical protein